MGLTPRDYTRSVLSRMQLSGSNPGNLSRDNDAESDNYGITAAKSSDASSFKMTGAPKSPHLGRPGRATGGRLTGTLQRNRRTPEETASDIANEDRVANELANDRGRAKGGRVGRAGGGGVQSEAARDAENDARVSRMSASERDSYANERRGGRVGRSTGGSATAKDEYTQAGRTMMNEDASGKDQFTGGNYPPSRATGGRTSFAKGGRTSSKGKTTVNVIIGGQKPAAPMPPPPMAAPGPVGPPMPPPMPPPGMGPGGPPGGAPLMGPGGPPPPGGPPMPMRARGGRIEISTPGKHDYGKAGVRHRSTDEKYGGGSGLGRMQNARHAK